MLLLVICVILEANMDWISVAVFPAGDGDAVMPDSDRSLDKPEAETDNPGVEADNSEADTPEDSEAGTAAGKAVPNTSGGPTAAGIKGGTF